MQAKSAAAAGITPAMVLGHALEVGDLFLAAGFVAGHHILKAHLALGCLGLGLPDTGLFLALLARLGRALAAVAALGAGPTLRRGLRALDGQRDLAVRCDRKHLDLYSLPIAEHGRKILHELIRNFRNMDKTRLALGQRNKCAERLDASDLPLDNIPNL